VDANVTPEQLKQAYRDLVRIWHPDRFTHDPRLQRKAEAKLKEINEAYEQLQSILAGSRPSETNNADAGPSGTEKKTKEEQESTSRSSAFRNPEPKSDAYAAGVKVRNALRGLQAWRTTVGVWFALFIASTIVTWTDRLHEPPMVINPTANFEPSISMPRLESAPPTSSGELAPKPKTQIESRASSEARSPATRLTKAELLALLHDDVIEKMKESHASAQKLLVLHEEERKKLSEEYERRKDLYRQGLITRDELNLTERALGEAMFRVDEDKRWIRESEASIREAEVRADILNRQASDAAKNRPIIPAK